jgi:putative methionine-R-sulfoxide reductase with GAF domain
MTPSQVFALVSNSLALITTLSVVLLVIFQRNWRTRTNQSLLQSLGSLAILEGGTLLTLTGRLADLPDSAVEHLFNVTLIGFFLATLTGLALLLHMANAMKDAWVIISRTGVAALVVLQPALWDHHLFRFSKPLHKTLMGSPYTGLGRIAAGVCAIYIVLTLFAGWRYRKQINAPLLVAPVMSFAAIQALTISTSALRELALTGASGGIASLLLGYHLIEHLDPRTSQARWMKTICAVSQVMGDTRSLEATLTTLAGHTRQLIRADVVTILRAIDTDRLEIVAASGQEPSMIGRQIRIGEGLAGRVMQTLSPMRVDDYHLWNGRAAHFDDVPIYASISVPLITNGGLVGTMNAHESSPGRVFTNHEQAILELLAPQVAITMAAARLEHDVHMTQTYLQAVMEYENAAAMIFDSAGRLCESNTAAQRYLRILLGEVGDPITVTQVAAQAEGEKLMHALARWMADPSFTPTLESEFPSLGWLIVDLRTITLNKPALLMVLRQPRHSR